MADSVPSGPPQTLDAVSESLGSGSAEGLRRYADLFDDARHSLARLAARFERELSALEEGWRHHGVDPIGGEEPLRRTRSLIHDLDGADYGRTLRAAADSLAAGQARVQDLQAQRSATADPEVTFDEQACAVLQGVDGDYRDIGVGLGAPPPPRPSADEYRMPAALREEATPVTLAAGPQSEGVDLFRPVNPLTAAGQLPGDPPAPPSGGGGGAAGGMTPFMPMGMGMGMGGGMGGAGGGVQFENSSQRRGAAFAGDQGVWGSSDGGWNVLGRKERVETPQEQRVDIIRQEQKKGSKGDKK